MKKGLSFKFKISNGRFILTEGEPKVRDNIAFFMSFLTSSRVYFPDFSPELLWLIQKPSSTVFQLRTLILAKLKNKLSRYIPEIAINRIGLDYIRSQKQYAFYLDFTYLFENRESDEIIEFI